LRCAQLPRNLGEAEHCIASPEYIHLESCVAKLPLELRRLVLPERRSGIIGRPRNRLSVGPQQKDSARNKHSREFAKRADVTILQRQMLKNVERDYQIDRARLERKAE
jgi:hypothetical protein